MPQFPKSSSSDVNGHTRLLPKKRCAEIDSSNIAQDTWPEPNAVICKVVLSMCDFIVCCAAVVRPAFQRHNIFGDSLFITREKSKSEGKQSSAQSDDRIWIERLIRTSKSCRLRHSSSGGRASKRACRSFSSCVTSLTTFCTVCRSTAPRLYNH